MTLDQARAEYDAAKSDYDAKLATSNSLRNQMEVYRTFIENINGNCRWRRGGGFPENVFDDPTRDSNGDCGWKKDEFFKLYGTDGTNGESGQANRVTEAALAVMELKQKQLDEAIKNETEIKIANLTPAEKLELQRTQEADESKRRTNRTILIIVIMAVVILGIYLLIRAFRKK